MVLGIKAAISSLIEGRSLLRLVLGDDPPPTPTPTPQLPSSQSLCERVSLWWVWGWGGRVFFVLFVCF